MNISISTYVPQNPKTTFHGTDFYENSTNEGNASGFICSSASPIGNLLNCLHVSLSNPAIGGLLHTGKAQRERFAKPLILHSSSTGKEKDFESGYHYFGARYYDSEALTGWLSVDPMSDKYPGISPYAYCAGNPIKLVDPDGTKLWIPNKRSTDHNQSKVDIVNLVNKKNQNRVSFGEDGSVSIDISGLDGKSIERMFKKDKGLALLDDLILSDKAFFYECSDYQTIDDNNMRSMEDDHNGMINASDGGLDSQDGFFFIPRKGFNGHVVLAKSGHWYNQIKKTGWDVVKKSIKISILYHELRENYYRTECGYNYNGDSSNGNKGAHDRASSDEGYYWGNEHPGKYDSYEIK